MRGSRTAMFVRFEHREYKIDVGFVGRMVFRRACPRSHHRGDAATALRQLSGFLVRGATPLEDCAGLHLRLLDMHSPPPPFPSICRPLPAGAHNEGQTPTTFETPLQPTCTVHEGTRTPHTVR